MRALVYMSPRVEIKHADDGWRYRSMEGNARMVRERPYVGPFATARDVAEAAVADLDLRDGAWVTHLLMRIDTSTMIGRATAELVIAVRREDPVHAEAARQLAAELAALDP